MLERTGAPRKRAIRCAIYTRKSSEEGLEQDFNSLHAQREACEAYIVSQRHEGWTALKVAYDDGGYSGGSMERPGLTRLLADIQSGLIDIVVVYKVDRLTRSLTDFAKMVEAFDARGVSFVSVTQSFNTTSSMGRLTLNVLLSFAQFEREVTGERIRDKIAASKKKGLWMGGYVPLGYAAEGRTLKIVEDDAAIVRRIYDRFLALGSIRLLKEELDRQRIFTPAYISLTNRQSGGRPFSPGHLRGILTSPIYVGEITHKGEIYPAQHPPIVERDVFDAVRDILALGRRERYVKTNAKNANLLAGLLFQSAGARLIGVHANKKGRRYRYYITRKPADDTSARLRIPAAYIESIVLKQLTAKLVDRRWLIDNILHGQASPDAIQKVTRRASELAANLQSTIASQQRLTLHSLVARIELYDTRVRIELRRTTLADVSDAAGVNHSDADQFLDAAAGTELIEIEIGADLAANGRAQRLILAADNAGDAVNTPDRPLIKATARGVTWYDDFVSGRAASFREIATRENITERYVAQMLPFAFLAPDLIRRLVEGEVLPMDRDRIKAGAWPDCWKEQGELIDATV